MSLNCSSSVLNAHDKNCVVFFPLFSDSIFKMLANPTGPSVTSVQSLRTSPSFLATTEAQPTVLSLLGLQWPLDWFPHVCSSFAVFNLAARSILLEHKSCCSSAQNPLITPHHFQAEARVAGIPCGTLCGTLGLCLDLPLHVRWLPSWPRTRQGCFSELLHGCPLCLEHSNCRYSVHSGLC